jgi:hypothetical protein
MNKQQYLNDILRRLAKLNNKTMMTKQVWLWESNHKELMSDLGYMVNWVDSKEMFFGTIYNEDGISGTCWWVYPASMTDEEIKKDLEDHGVNIDGDTVYLQGEKYYTNVLLKRRTKRNVLAIRKWYLNI